MINAAKKSILVVDDDWTSRQILSQMLAHAGYRVFPAESGEQALALAQEQVMDAFLLDIKMPGMGGIELCRRLRASPAFKMTPILFVTAMDEQSNLREAFAAGCDDFITKPVNPIILEARLTGHLQKTEYFNQLERVRRNLNRYISPRTMKMVETYSATGILPPPQEHEVCIFFSDIRGFTALFQEIDPARLFSLLSQHLGAQVDRVYQRGGYIDKFGGDGVMAVFDGADKVVQCCWCALDIMGAAQDQYGREHALQLGIGMHLGRALIGNIGSAEHLDYTVIGDAVNLAARLCGYAEPASIIVSKVVREAVGEEPGLRFSNERSVSIRGMKHPVTVYTLSRAR